MGSSKKHEKSSQPKTPPAERRTTTAERPNGVIGGATMAQRDDYDSYFGLFGAWRKTPGCLSLSEVLEGKDGTGFVSAGFVPGPAFVLEHSSEGFRIRKGTFHVADKMEELPSPWVPSIEDLPQEISTAVKRWEEVIEVLGEEPYLWDSLLVTRALREQRLPARLVMVMLEFQYPTGGPSYRTGIVLEPGEYPDEMNVVRVYSPDNLASFPVVGDMLRLDKVKSEGPFQKLFWTCWRMEKNWKDRFVPQKA